MTWALVDNPEFAGMKPRILEAVCHDLTPILTVECSFCKEVNHIHEGQLAGMPQDAELAMRCSRCGIPSVTTVAFARSGFAELRRLGWIK